MFAVPSGAKGEFVKGFFIGSGVVVAIMVIGFATGVVRRAV